MITPLRAALVASLALAAASLALPFLPVYDPWAWLVWGRQLLEGGLETASGPSWKPLPVLIDAPLSLLGGAAPDAWLLVARTGWILAALLAGLLAARLAGAGAGRWRWAAALLAAASVALTGDGVTPPLRQFSGGLSEPLLVALVLGAIWAALDERPGLVLALGTAASLLRPECWPFLAVWAYFATRQRPRLRAAALGAGALVLAAWFVPDVIGAGSPLEGGETARGRDFEPLDAAEAVGRALAAPLAAAWLGLAMLIGLGRGRLEPALRILLLGSLAWIALVAAMAVIGFAGLPRFLAPATAVIAVLGATGLARAGAAAFSRDRSPLIPSAPSSRLLPHSGKKDELGGWGGVLPAVVAVTIAVGVAGAGLRAAEWPQALRTVRNQASSLNDVFELTQRLGAERLLACGGTVKVTQLLPQTALAWRLEQPIAAIPVRKQPLYGIALSVKTLPRGVEIARAERWRATRLPCASGYRRRVAGARPAQPPASSASARAIAGVSGAAR